MARPTNHDKRINDLLAQLRRALVAKEQARIEATVEAQMAGLVGGLGRAGAAMVAAPAPATTPKTRKGWSASAKAKARERMKKYWAAKKSKGGTRGKAAKAAPAEAPKA